MICFVFRRKRRKTRKGKTVKETARVYTGRYKLAGDLNATTIALGITDKRVAEEKLRRIVADEERKRAGLLLPVEQVNAATQPMTKHLADFIKDLASRQKSKSHRRNIRHQVNGLIESCGWIQVRDITAESFTTWRDRQAGKTAKSAKTLNDYLDAMSSLLNWMIDQRRLTINPLSSVKRVDARGRQTFERDALTQEEFERLLRHAGGNRRFLYFVAVMTCLRRGALHKLTWADVNLDVSEPFIRVRALNNKNRQEQICELRDDVAAVLRQLRPAGYKSSARVFSRILPHRGTQFLKDDLKAAGIKRASPHRIDFHALRHTACTWAGNSGQGSNVRLFSGHKTDSQLSRYTHPSRAVARAVVDSLPRFDGVLAESICGTHIGTQKQVTEGHSESLSVTVGNGESKAKIHRNGQKTSIIHVENARHVQADYQSHLPDSNR